MAPQIFRIMRLCCLCLFYGGSFASLLAQVTQPANSAKFESNDSPRNLLIGSYLASQQLLPEERAMVLMQLAISAAEIEPAYNRLWSQELFNSAFQLPLNWNRLAYEKNALEALSESDPLLALQLFDQMDNPIPTDSGSFPEDVRAFAAQRVFSAYWKKKGLAGLDEITAQAQQLGDSGQYPYVAMIPIVLDLAKSSQNRSEALFNEAASYFSRGSRFDSANPDFVQFLNGVWDILPALLKHQGLQVAVDQLTRQQSTDADAAYRGKSRTKSADVQFTDRNKQLLFDLLPRIREVDGQWAKRLVDNDPFLAGAMESGGIQRSSSATLQGISSASPAQMATAEGRLAQRQIFSQVEQQAGKDPDDALLTSRSITDPELQAIALADIAAGFAKKDPGKASKFLSQANSITAELKDNPAKVMALFAITKADHELNDQKAMQTAWNRAFDLGQQLFQEDIEAHPVRLAYQAACFDTLRNLAKFGGKFDPPMIMQGLRKVQNQLLRAYLPISAADGIFQYDQLRLPDATVPR